MAESKPKSAGSALGFVAATSVVFSLLCGCQPALSSHPIHSPKDYAVVTPLPSRPLAAPTPAKPPEETPQKVPEQTPVQRPEQRPPVQPPVVVSNPVPSVAAVVTAPPKPVEQPTPAQEHPPRKNESASKIDLAAEKLTLMQRDFAFSETSESKGLAEAFYEFMSADATLLREGEPPIKGKEAIRVRMAAGQQGTLTWKPEEATVAAQADMAFTWGTYVFRSQGPERRTSRGQYVTVWEKQSGQWKVVLWSSSTSPAAAPRRSELGTQ